MLSIDKHSEQAEEQDTADGLLSIRHGCDVTHQEKQDRERPDPGGNDRALPQGRRRTTPLEIPRRSRFSSAFDGSGAPSRLCKQEMHIADGALEESTFTVAKIEIPEAKKLRLIA